MKSRRSRPAIVSASGPRGPCQRDGGDLCGQAEHLAGHQAGGRAGREPHPARASAGEIERDVRSRVARPDDHDRPAAVGTGVAVGARVDDALVADRPLRHHRLAVVAGRDHDGGRVDRRGPRRKHEARLAGVHPPDLGPRADLEPFAGGVALEVAEKVRSRHPAPV
jgi:hypothetical protein